MQTSKNVIFSLLFICCFGLNDLFAQEPPRSFVFQGIARQNGYFLKDMELDLEVSILDSIAMVVYYEEHTATTSGEGVFTIYIGEGDNPSMPFEDIDWGADTYSIQVSVYYKGTFYFDMPATRLLAVPVANFAHHAHSTDDWTNVGDTILYRLQGRVGIGTDDPQAKLEVVPDIRAEFLELHGNGDRLSLINTPGTADYRFFLGATGDLTLSEDITDTHFMHFDPSGRVGVFTTSPSTDFHVVGNARASQFESIGNGTRISLTNTPGSRNYQFNTNNSGDLAIYESNMGRYYLHLDADNRIGIFTNNPQAELDVNGRTRTRILEIVGGMDITEPFEMSNEESLEAGTVVVIDPENPGLLKACEEAYDKGIAGVISGAGGINPGLSLSQEGVVEDGQPVALTGRVYVKASAANGSIQPGDLLTSSDIPGYAMKATKRKKSFGAVIGKAMSALEEGEGLVLVLINLQ